MFHDLIILPACVPIRGYRLCLCSCSHLCNSAWEGETGEVRDKSKCLHNLRSWLFIIYFRGIKSPPSAPSDTQSLSELSITWVSRAGQWGSLSSSYLLTQLMEVCICISPKWVKRGLELDSIQAGRSLSHCTNETIHHCFVCLYAPSHEQLMCCRHFSAFLLFLYLTFRLSLSHFWGLSLRR